VSPAIRRVPSAPEIDTKVDVEVETKLEAKARSPSPIRRSFSTYWSPEMEVKVGAELETKLEVNAGSCCHWVDLPLPIIIRATVSPAIRRRPDSAYGTPEIDVSKVDVELETMLEVNAGSCCHSVSPTIRRAPSAYRTPETEPKVDVELETRAGSRTGQRETRVAADGDDGDDVIAVGDVTELNRLSDLSSADAELPDDVIAADVIEPGDVTGPVSVAG